MKSGIISSTSMGQFFYSNKSAWGVFRRYRKRWTINHAKNNFFFLADSLWLIKKQKTTALLVCILSITIVVTYCDVNVCYIQTKSVPVEPSYKKGYYRKSILIIMVNKSSISRYHVIKTLLFSSRIWIFSVNSEKS